MIKRYRRLPLEGLNNARDLGGWTAAGGRQTNYGVFIRSEMPNGLTGADLRFLQDYGVTLTIDLRGDDEVKHFPSKLAGLDWADYIRYPALNEQMSMGGFKMAEKGLELEKGWGALYCLMVEGYKGWMKSVLEAMAEAEGAVHYHCTTGKDRTGLISMAVLGLCGVEDVDIIADYAVSQIYLKHLYADFSKMLPPGSDPVDADSNILKTSPAYMEELLGYIRERYGSVAGYVVDCGVSAQTVERIREKFLD